jgi:lipopolysaccharide transport system ATP-binding protein
MRPLITVDDVWKKFRRGERHDTLRDLLLAVPRRLRPGRAVRTEAPDATFWAVKGLSFQVGAGEAVGIIGANGAGKSTVLKLLTRILRPTRGTCDLQGRVGALIEVAAGFHPDLTGRENVYLQGAVMGMKRVEITRAFDDIVAFAGLPAFIDTQVKRYSSGMNARLGFAIAAHLSPQVLIIDEVLSVGDAAFQERCTTRMQKLIADGVPLVFVSHNLPAVLQLCTRAILLENGETRFDGAPADAVRAYQQALAHARPQAAPASDAAIVISKVELLGPDGCRSDALQTGAPATVRVHYEARRPVQGPHIAVDLHRADGVYCCGVNTRMADRDLGRADGPGVVDLNLLSLPLLPGCYTISVGILDAQCLLPYDLRDRAYPFSVVSGARERGLFHLDYQWRIHAAASDARVELTQGVA